MTINERVSDETLDKIIEAADEVITALAGTNEDVHKNDSAKMCQLWDDLNDRYATPAIVKALAAEIKQYRAAADPVAWRYRYTKPGVTDSHGEPWVGDWKYVADEENCNPMKNYERQPLYTAPQVTSVPDVSDLEKVLRFIESLPVPTKGAGINGKRLYDFIVSCRAAMLAAPAVQAEPLSVTDAEHVASVLEMIGSFEPDDIDSDSVDMRFELNGVDTGSDVSITDYATRGAAIIRQLSGNTEQAIGDAFISEFERLIHERDSEIDAGQLGSYNYTALLKAASDAFATVTGNSPVITDGWIPVSERMPDVGDYVVCMNATRSGAPFVAFRCESMWVSGSNYQPEVTHWKPLPAAPQQEAE